MLRNQISKSHLALRLCASKSNEMLKSISTLTSIASYTIIGLAGATSMSRSENGLHIKIGESRLTDRQILKIFLPGFRIQSAILLDFRIL